MYEYNKNINVPETKIERLPSKVTVEEKFNEDGVLISRTTITEYETGASNPQAYTINLSGMDFKQGVEDALKNIRPRRTPDVL